MKIISYGRQYVDDDDIRAVVDVLRSDFLTQGPKVKEFEDALAEYVGARFVVVFSSGTAALHAAYNAVGLSPKDEFITSPITFVATSNAGLYLGAVPVFVDVEADTGNIDVSKVEGKITSRTKLIVPVHYAGHPVDMERLYDVAQRHGIHIIEDACHALGARYKDTRVGFPLYSDMVVFSFHPVKHITTGEGGAVATNSECLYERLLLFRQHGITKHHFVNLSDGPWYYEMQELGFNYRLTDMQSALGISQLRKLSMFVEKRRQIVSWYEKLLGNSPYLDIPKEREYAFSSWHLYSVRLKEDYIGRKKELFERLAEDGIRLQVHYIPVYMHPYYQKLGYKAGICPIAEDFYRKEMSLPIYYLLTEGDVYYVVSRIHEILGERT